MHGSRTLRFRIPFTIGYGQVDAIAATLLISWLNYLGVRRAGEFQFLFTLLKVAIILGIVAVGFSYQGGTWSNFATEFTGAKGGVAGFFAALVAALWAYDSWNDLTMVAGEIRNPQRNIPLSLIWGVATVGALYILVNAAVQSLLPAAAIAGLGASCVRRGGAGAGARGRQPGVGGHGAFDAGNFEWHHHERSARTVYRRRAMDIFSKRSGRFIRASTRHRWRSLCSAGWRLFCCCWEAVSGSSFPWRFSRSGCST